METILQTCDLAIGYRDRRGASRRIAQGLDLALKSGELVCLLGPNGAGKSTLIRTLAGLQKPLAGSVRLEGRELTTVSAEAKARRVAIVLTERISVGYMTARQLVELGRIPHTNAWGSLTRADAYVVEQVMHFTETWRFRDRDINALSDGERQKVMIARALAQEPRLLILDEPTAFLDPTHRLQMLRLLLRLTRESGIAVLMSTHDLELTLKTADRCWLMRFGQPLVQGAPEDLVLAGIFGEAFAVDGIVFDHHSGTFNLSPAENGVVGLTADGTTGLWTDRALQRAGYRIAADHSPPPLRVSVIEVQDTPRWELNDHGHRSVFTSLYALIDQLRRRSGD
jgi:iron complex transport system ATP-binding protein